jgi:hypothetical protein
MTKVIRLEPFSMAVFSQIDVDPGFAVKLCNDVTLFSAVHDALFVGAPDDDTRAETADVVAKLRDVGDVAFEDGWISLRVGMTDVTAFLMEKLKEAKDEERWADRQRFNELKAKEEAEGRYALLRQALVDALGDKAAEIAARAA